jgi:hypothetical protein
VNGEPPEPDVLTRSQLLERRGYDGTEEPYGLVADQDPAPPPKRTAAEGLAAANERRHAEKLAREAANGTTLRSNGSTRTCDDVWSPKAVIGTVFDLGGTLELAFGDDVKLTAWRG